MDYRHEIKHEINYSDLISIRQRLRAVARGDPHSIDGKYEIRSIYFDNWTDDALREKIDGVNIRNKFRIRYYNADRSFIILEKKSKINNLCCKDNVNLTPEQAVDILDGNIEWMKSDNNYLINELYENMVHKKIIPKTIVDYTREAYTYQPGNVRVTLDYNIRSGLCNTDFFNSLSPTVPIEQSVIILEVKWDGFLPDIIRDIVQLNGRHSTAFSKYAICRIYD